jgi:hypothetical protein
MSSRVLDVKKNRSRAEAPVTQKKFESSPGSSAVVPSRGTNEGAADAVMPDGIRKEAALVRTVLQGVGRGGALEDGKKAGGGCAGGDAKDRRRRQRRR